LLKTDAAGVEQWSQTFGGPGQDIGFEVIQTPDNGYAIAGRFRNTNANRYLAYLVKTDINGTLQWSAVYNASQSSEAQCLAQTPDGGFVLAGYITDPNTGFDQDFYISKTDANGAQEWKRSYGGLEDDQAYDIATTMDGGFIVVGTTEAGFGANTDMYAIKLDGNGYLRMPIAIALPSL
jgi:hypothetical protein